MGAHKANRLRVALCDRRMQAAPLSFGGRWSATAVNGRVSDGGVRFLVLTRDRFAWVELECGLDVGFALVCVGLGVLAIGFTTGIYFISLREIPFCHWDMSCSDFYCT